MIEPNTVKTEDQQAKYNQSKVHKFQVQLSISTKNQQLLIEMGCGCFQAAEEYPQQNTQSRVQFSQEYEDQIAFGNELLADIAQTEMNKRLHRHIVAIIWRKNQKVGRGSGLLISKNLVLTSAHNLVQQRRLVDAKLFQIYVAPCGLMKKFYKVDCIYVPPEYMTAPKSESIVYDYALIKLAERVETEDFICLKPYDYKEIKEMAIYGYPFKNYTCNSSNIQSVFQSGKTKQSCVQEIRIERSQMLHKISTHIGQSGSPVIEKRGEQLTVRAIHKGGVTIFVANRSEKKQLNTGRLITEELIGKLVSQANLIGGEKFRIYGQMTSTKDIKSSKNNESREQLIQPSSTKTLLFDDGFDEQLKRQSLIESLPPLSQDLSVQQLMKKGDELFNRSQFKRARQYYRRILKMKPYDSKAYMNLGLALYADGMIQQAIKAYLRAVRIDPANYLAYYNLGACYQQLKNTKLARKYYQVCQNIKPDHQNSFLRLSQLS